VSLRLVIRSATVPALLGGMLLPALPADASVDRHAAEPAHITLARGEGMPTTSEPSRTIGAAEAWVRPATDATAEVAVSVTLGGTPTAETAADLRIGIGHPDGSTCLVADTWVVRTDDAAYADPSAPEGVAALAVSHEVPAHEASGSACLVVAISDPADVTGAALDSWTGVPDRFSPLRAAPGQARIVDVGHTRVPARTWSWVEVRVRVRFHGVTSIRLDGRGRDLRVRPVTVTGDFDRKELVLLTLPVKLCAGDSRTLRLDTAVAGVSQPLVDRERVRIRAR
jgi:hypothetical protein